MATKITSAEQAVQAIQEISETSITESVKEQKAYAVGDYLKQNTFRTIVDRTVTTASVRGYYAGLHNPGAGNIVSFQPTQPYSNPFAAINVWFVPTVSIDTVIANNNKIPTQSLATIDITKSQPPFICTEKLTGCCFVIGWIQNKGIMYLGHIQPSEKYDRTYVANYVRQHEILPVPKSTLSQYICFGGDDNELPSAYNNYNVNIIGFILLTRIWMVFQFQYGKERGSMMWDYQKK